MTKKNKVRTSITIDPELLAKVKTLADKSVSAYIEKALEAKVIEDEHACASTTGVCADHE